MKRFAQFLVFAVCFVAVLFLAACAYLYVEQDSLIFRGVSTDPVLAEQWRAKRIAIPSGESNVEGWWIDNPDATSNNVLLYFGGNMEDVLLTATTTAAHVNARRVLVTNYRGYGGTPGKPSEAALFKDALAVYDYAVQQSAVTPSNIVLVGRSLGSGLATYVAANRAVRGVVLVTPYDSIVGVAQEMYPLLPIGLIVRHPFRSVTYARKVTAPALFLAGTEDIVIPAKHAQRLFDVWVGPKEIHVLTGVGHNNMSDNPQYYPLMNTFLDSLSSAIANRH